MSIFLHRWKPAMRGLETEMQERCGFAADSPVRYLFHAVLSKPNAASGGVMSEAMLAAEKKKGSAMPNLRMCMKCPFFSRVEARAREPSSFAVAVPICSVSILIEPKRYSHSRA